MASVRAAQSAVVVVYAMPWPVPVVRAAQTTLAVLCDPSPPPGGGGANVSMLCQVIG